MSPTKRPTKRSSSTRRQGGDPAPKGWKPSGTQAVGRRFTPTLKSVTEGGRVYGGLVTEKRVRLGLSQKQLAALIQTSTATVERIEKGHPPGAELSNKLARVLAPERPNGPIRRLVSSVPVPHPPRLSPPSGASVGSRRLWTGVAVGLAVVILAFIASRLISGNGAPAAQPAVKVSSSLGAPAAISQARVHAQKEAAAEARRAAKEERERERAAAAAAAAAAARKAQKAAAREQNSSTEATTVAPVETPPASSGGGGSSAPKPEIQHGIGSGGGLTGD